MKSNKEQSIVNADDYSVESPKTGRVNAFIKL